MSEIEILKEHIDDWIIGQKLTSPNKKYVYLPTHEKLKGFVYKGPYSKNEKRNIMLEERIEILRKWNTKALLPEIINYKNEIWYKYPFLGDYDNITYEIVNNKKILNRESINIIQLSKLTDDKIYDILFGESFLFKDFLDFALLNIGDSGPWNTLCFNDSAYLIDFEDTRKTKMTSLIDIFTKRSKKMDSLIQKGLSNKLIQDKINKHLELRNAD